MTKPISSGDYLDLAWANKTLEPIYRAEAKELANPKCRNCGGSGRVRVARARALQVPTGESFVGKTGSVVHVTRLVSHLAEAQEETCGCAK